MTETITHEELMGDSLIIRCLGRLDGYAVYEAKSNFRPAGGWGVTVTSHKLNRDVWKRVVDDLRTREDRMHLPRNIFLATWQVESLMKWAEGDFAPMTVEQSYCEDCKGTGVYTGIVRRYPCPTCQK